MSVSSEQDGPRPDRRRDPEGTRREILDIATEEFAERGYAGARVDEIAARMRTTKRMIYYYFGGKEQLYVAALERAYAEIRAKDSELDLDGLDPVTGLRQIIRSTYDYHVLHPHFVRLVGVENVHHAEHLSRLQSVGRLGAPAVDTLAAMIRRGREAGVFVRDVDPLDVHMLISSYSAYQVAHQYTFKALFGRDLMERAMLERHRALLEELVLGFLTSTGTPPAFNGR
jgi:AcrR family transcriptional regulator